MVLAADPVTDVWTPREVLDQWSHLDNGHMATVTLADGSTVTATDHHKFWVASDGSWIELDQVRPGDSLLTPDGITQVANVTITKRQTTLVWELDTAINDTFTVHTGTHDLLVHNQDDGCEGGDDGDDSNSIPPRRPTEVTGPNGEALPGVPPGAQGVPADNGRGLRYELAEGTDGIDPRVTEIRVMDPIASGPNPYPDGYVVYMNEAGQTVNPLTGRTTVGKSDPFAHIALPPR